MNAVVDDKLNFVSIDNLVFDAKNPRLPTAKAGAKDEVVIRYMLDESNLIDVMLSIATQDYFVGEPLIVIPIKDNKYEVLEGNRRLAALKLLQNPDLAPVKKISVREIAETARYKPDKVPVLIYNSRQDVIRYLGYRHITGVDSWGSLAKAKYLNQLKDNFPNSSYAEVLKELAKIIGSRTDYVHKLLSGYQLFKEIEKNDFFGISDLSEAMFPFSLLTTALSYSNINEYIGLDSTKSESIENLNIENLRDLSEWIFKENEGRTRLGESRNLKTLSAVIASPRALKAFKEQGRPLEESRLLTDEPQKSFSEAIQQSLNRLIDARDTSHHVPQPLVSDMENLREIYKIARELSTVVKSKIVDPEESEI